MKFKKISAIFASTLMAGLTIAGAAAASFPAPFTQNGPDGVAIVYGTGAGVSPTDLTQAGNIQTTLAAAMPKTGGTTVDGQAFMLDKSSNHFNYGNALNGVYSDLDEEQMPEFLADGTYDDGEVDEDYQQKITLSTKTLSLFSDIDYEDDTPAIGFWWTNNQEILNYEFNLDNEVLYADLVDTNLPLMGKEYYVLAASTTQIDLLDSSQKTTIAQGESAIVDGKTVSIEYVDLTDVKLTIDGETTPKLGENEYDELADGSYVVVNEILYDSKEVGVSKVVFSIGAGKIELIDGNEIQLNDEDVDGLEVTFTDGSTNSSYLDTITLTWNSYRDTFLTEDNPISMPAFGAIQLAFGGLNLPTDTEMISVENGETLNLNMGNFDLPIAWYSGSVTALGEENYPLVAATSTITNTTWTTPNLNVSTYDTLGSISGGLALSEDDRIIVTSIGTDLSDVETMYYEVNSIENSSGTIEVVLEDLIGTNDLTFDSLEALDRGVITAQLLAVNGTTAGQAYLNFSTSDSGATVYYNKVVSEKGLVITLPTDVSSVTTDVASNITFQEANKNEDIMSGAIFNATFKVTTNDKLHVSTTNVSTEEESDNVFFGYVVSDLASKINLDTSADEYDFSIEYAGTEVTADVYVGSSDAVISGTGSLGNVLVKDSEVSNFSGKNLIIVGGSCINSAAATALGVPEHTCGTAFTAATGVGAGEFLIKSVADAFTTGKIALVVAGYDVADTANGATYLRTKTVDTTAGKTYKGTTATTADLVVQ